jgi:hypothetical protein
MVRSPSGSRTSTNPPEAKSNGQGEGQAFMIDNDKPTSQPQPMEITKGAMDEYKARRKAERAKMAKLRVLRLAAQAKAAGEAEAGR